MCPGQLHGMLPTGGGRASAATTRPRRFHRRAVACLLAALLSACGGGGGGGTDPEPPAGADYFPLAVGNRWLYGNGGDDVLMTVSVTGTTSVDGIPGYTVQSVAASGDTWSSVYAKSDTALWQYPTSDDDELTQAIGRIPLLRMAAAAGETFTQMDQSFDDRFDFDGDGRTDRYSIRAQVTVIGHESIDTPAGTFPQSLHQRTATTETVVYSSTGTTDTVQVDMDDWYAPGVGLARTRGTVLIRGITYHYYQELRGYRAGALASETVAPTIVGITPEPGATVAAHEATVRVTFSEAMDAASLAAGGLTVTDSGGRAVAGQASASDSLAIFLPESPWSSGTYTVQVTPTATDLVGNPFAATQSWLVTIDAERPMLVSSTPPDGSVGVSPDAPIVLRFSEPLDPASVTPSSVYLTDGSQSVSANLEMNGATVTLTPVQSLQRGRHYWLHVNSVADTLGNLIPEWITIEFDTDQGGFAYPAVLAPGQLAEAVAIGDVNSDGINDLVMTSQIQRPGRVDSALFILAGRADGTLAEPVQVGPAPIVAGYATAVAIGDVNGDGRADVVVGGDFGGVQVLLQSPTGGLLAGASFNHGGFGRLRIADIDADGRSDVVGVGAGFDTFSILRQGTDGQLALAASVPLGFSGVWDLEVADVNGDGRVDLLAAISQLVVVTQNADGSFASPVQLPADPIWGARSVAVGDLNGDGRTDVAVATGGNSPTSIGVYYQDAAGALGAMQAVASYDIPAAIRAADIDGDGRTDLVVAHQGWNAVGVYLQSAGGTLAAERLFRGSYGNWNPNSLAVGDLTRDGRVDIVVENSLLIQQQGLGGVQTQAQARPTARPHGATPGAATRNDKARPFIGRKHAPLLTPAPRAR